MFHANVFLQIALYVQTNEAETREFRCWFMCPYEDFIRDIENIEKSFDDVTLVVQKLDFFGS